MAARNRSLYFVFDKVLFNKSLLDKTLSTMHLIKVGERSLDGIPCVLETENKRFA